MKSCIIALAFCTFTVADVSHLASQYLPPVLAWGKSTAPTDGQITTTIEKQELRELPEQIEFMREGESPLSAVSEAAPMQKLMQTAIPATEYLPPIMKSATAHELHSASPSFLAPVAMFVVDMERPTEHMKTPIQYLPPSTMPEFMQPTYQQYQEKLMLMQRSREMMRMSTINSQPVTPFDLDSSTQEPPAAHQLSDDGYHYKVADEENGFTL